MIDYNRVLDLYDDFIIDRIPILKFDENILNRISPSATLTNSYTSMSNGLKIENNNHIIINCYPTLNLDDRSYIECDLKVDIEFDKCIIDLCEGFNGTISKKEVEYNNIIPANKVQKINFELSGQLDNRNRELSNIRSVKISFPSNYTTLELYKCVAFNDDYNITIEEIDLHYGNAEQYIKNMIGLDHVPTELTDAAYLITVSTLINKLSNNRDIEYTKELINKANTWIETYINDGVTITKGKLKPIGGYKWCNI